MHLYIISIISKQGGFTEVGETSEESVARELKEEMNINLSSKPILFGVYGDPKRDHRRHTTSVVYYVNLPSDVIPRAGDDATGVVRIGLDDIEQHECFVDHKSIIRDFVNTRKGVVGLGIANEMKRSICPSS